MTDGKRTWGDRFDGRAPLLVLLGLVALGAVLAAFLVRPKAPIGTPPPSWTGPMPARGEPLATRLAVVVLEELGDVVFAEPAVMDFLEEARLRGAGGPVGPGPLDWKVGAPGRDLEQLLAAGGLEGLAFGDLDRAPRLPSAGGGRRSAFDEAAFDRLDRSSWQLFRARLAPEPAAQGDEALFVPGTRSPTELGFALSALDHELRRLVLRVGSHLTLLVIRKGAALGDWTLSGPGADDPKVLAALREERFGTALALLLGFRLD